jgi:ribosome-binding factor A
MASSNRRPDRVAEAIRVEVAKFLQEEAKDPRIGFVTVTGVEMTRDLRVAKVFVSAMGSDEERQATHEGLNALAPRLRGHLGRALRLRLAPELIFRPDESIGRAARIETLLESLKRGENPAAGDPDEDAPRGGGSGDGEDERGDAGRRDGGTAD